MPRAYTAMQRRGAYRRASRHDKPVSATPSQSQCIQNHWKGPTWRHRPRQYRTEDQQSPSARSRLESPSYPPHSIGDVALAWARTWPSYVVEATGFPTARRLRPSPEVYATGGTRSYTESAGLPRSMLSEETYKNLLDHTERYQHGGQCTRRRPIRPAALPWPPAWPPSAAS